MGNRPSARQLGTPESIPASTSSLATVGASLGACPQNPTAAPRLWARSMESPIAPITVWWCSSKARPGDAAPPRFAARSMSTGG